jgi:prepilin-type N-terminal cleavage/methylation domain-containing protein
MLHNRASSGKTCRLSTNTLISGFTLVELLISVSIIGLITAVVVFNQSDFADQIALSNVVNEIELDIRENQIYGVSVKEFQPGSLEFSSAYGSSFNLIASQSGALGPVSYISFIDRIITDGKYNFGASWSTCTVGGGSECININSLTRGNTIMDLCVRMSANNDVCRSGGSGPSRIDITFLRPNPNARIAFLDSAGANLSFAGHIGAKVILRSPQGKTQSVVVYTTGQIAIE